MNIKRQLVMLSACLVIISSLVGTSCATKKYVRKTVNERVTPLEGRTQELEETVRRNTQEIRDLDDRLSKRIDEVDTRVNRAQETAERATDLAQKADSRAQDAGNRADNADRRAGQAQQNVEDLRSNLDKFSLQETIAVNFRVNSAQLDPKAQQSLDEIASKALTAQGYILEIQGFTDSSGNIAANEVLSQRRAEAVQRYLAKAHQIPVYKMSILGLGKAEERETSRQARAQNRRVEVRLLTNDAVNKEAAGAGNQQQ
jgi:outer membrane protein OmpA-like peptidoglycan-associated protein